MRTGLAVVSGPVVGLGIEPTALKSSGTTATAKQGCVDSNHTALPQVLLGRMNRADKLGLCSRVYAPVTMPHNLRLNRPRTLS